MRKPNNGQKRRKISKFMSASINVDIKKYWY